MFCCEQAAAFAGRACEVVAAEENGEVEAYWAEAEDPPLTPELRWLVWWHRLNSEEFEYDYARQKELMPAMDSEHSGNTFGSAVNLAIMFVLLGCGDEQQLAVSGRDAVLAARDDVADGLDDR